MRIFLALAAAAGLAAGAAGAATAPPAGAVSPAPAFDLGPLTGGVTAEELGVHALVSAPTLEGGVKVASKERHKGGKRGGAKHRHGKRYKHGHNKHRKRYGNRRVYHHHHHHGRDNDGFDAGSAVLGGIIGLGVGAIIMNSANQSDPVYVCPDGTRRQICDNGW